MKPSRGFTFFDLFLLQIIVGLIALVTVPTFLKFQARSKQSEAKANLKALYMAEKAYFQEKDTYDSNPSVVGFAPERGNRYQYNLLGNSTDHLEGRSTLDDAVEAIVRRTRAFARRQRMWFRRDPRITWMATGRDPLALLPTLLGNWSR